MCRFLLLLSLFSLFLSCKSFHPGEMETTKTDLKVVRNLYFSSTEDYVYKTSIDVYGHHISGISIIKKINENHYRCAVTTDFGNKIMDFEINQNDFSFRYILPDLDKKIVKNFLQKDFTLLLKPEFYVKNSFKNSENNIYTSELEHETYFLYCEKEQNLLQKIVYTKNNREKTDIIFKAKNPIFADEIEIQHKDFKINIQMKKLENQP